MWLADGCEFSAFILMGITGIVFGTLFGLLIGTALETPIKYDTRYQVIITDEVKMSEFSERYEVLNQKGKIYTVRER
jgi:hypothetical protein